MKRQMLFAAIALGCGLVAAPARAQSASPDLQGAVARLNGLRDVFQTKGVLPTAKDFEPIEQSLTAAADVAMKRQDWSQVAQAFVHLNWAERMQGRWEPAIVYAQKALQAARQAKSTEYQAKAMLGLAKAELSRKNLGPAAEHAEGAVQLAEAEPDAKLRFETLDNWSQVQVALGQTNAAAETLNRALSLPGLKDDSFAYGYMGRAEIYLKHAERCDYLPDYGACLQSVGLSRADNQRAMAAARRLGWASIEQQVQGFNKQLDIREWMIQSRRNTEETMDSVRLFQPTKPSDVLVNEHFAPATNPGMAETVEPLYRKTQEADQRPKGFAASSSARLLYIDGILARSRADHAKALRSFQQAVEVLEKDEHALPDEASRTAFFSEYFDMYVAAALELLDAKRYAEAFSMIEKSRARAMADLLASRRLDLGGGNENQLYADKITFDVQIAKQQTELHRLFLLGGSRDEIGAVESELTRLRDSRGRLLSRMASEAPRLGRLTTDRLMTLGELQALAKSDRCEVIEYLVTETNIVIWYIGPTSVQVKNVFFPHSALQNAVRTLREQLATPKSKFEHERARALFLQLVQPVKPLLRGTRLLILPHDALTHIPFEVLEDPSDNRPLGATFDVAYAPSATIYRSIRSWSPGGKGPVLVVSDPKLEAEKEGHEGRRVADVYRAQDRQPNPVFIGKDTLKRTVANADVVHLSVHGHFDEANPLLSYIALAGEKGKDNTQLTAAEMFGLPLAKTSLVVLSACESGKLSVTRGNEVLGMARGLLYAGAGALVLSRWKVDAPATALWMETFHREAQKRGLPEAARLASKTVREDARYMHPYYWSAFSLVAR